MARARKSWQEKLATAREKMPAPRIFFCEKSKQQFVIPSLAELERFLSHIPPHQLLTISQITDTLRDKHKVDVCCPMTTGIIAWLLAHAEDEAERTTGHCRLPWWRLLKTGGELNPKYPGQGTTQRQKLEAEGHHIIAKGKRLFVDGWQDLLAKPFAP